MATFLFNEIVFGPLKSRRLGVSLGINLLPANGKLCSFDCVYCECGMNNEHTGGLLPKFEEVMDALKTKLTHMHETGVIPDVITFAGNGEPTLHPDFVRIIDETLKLRNHYFPNTRVSVLSNATQIGKPEIHNALLKVDQAILKLDSAFDETVRILNRPTSKAFTVRQLVNEMKAFKGKLIVQTLFVRGVYKSEVFDNTTTKEVSAWIDLIKEIKPESVMIYAIDRDTPIKSVVKVTLSELNEIALKAMNETGISVSVAG
jgi:wyosine [tRNA(Phe)-imidazoG37] synthetase (radical SAM superfamily)